MTIRHQHQHHQAYSERFSLVFFGFSAVILVVSIGFYLASTNAIAIEGNNSNRFEKKIQDVSKQYRQLQVEMAELSSLQHLRENGGDFQPIAPGEILYVSGSGPIALR